MKHPGASDPIASFDIAPIPPKAVAEAAKRFDDVATKWAALVGDAEDATAAIEAAKAKDIADAAEALVAGDDVADPTLHEREARQRLAVIEAALPSLRVAVDRAGNDLAAVIDANREAWLEKIDAQEEKTAARYAAAVTEAQAALAALKPLRGAIEWLENFDTREATMGYQPQFAGGRVVVKVRSGLFRGDHAADELLRFAAQATESTTEPVSA
jgi:hypothetical protein